MTMSGIWVHCGIALVVRLLFIVYGEIQDNISAVQYTDIDYKVFTDAARHITEGNSPFARHTYRYSPLLAILLTPNIFLHICWGKVLFSILDIIAGFLIHGMILLNKTSETVAIRSTLFWLYNPLVIVISTRGNADSISAVLVLLTLMLQQKDSYILAGLMHGLAIHFRIYPIVFSLGMYLSIPNNSTKITKHCGKIMKIFHMIRPNRQRLQLVFSCIITLFFTTAIFYNFYGFKFLYESILFHLKRRDIRHNFSVYFYLQYLSSVSMNHVWVNVLTVSPQIILMFVLSLVFGSRKHLPFCQLCLAIVLVMYNSVLTCQYFLWFISLLPLSLPYLKFTKQQTLVLSALWFVAQIAWLLPAYWLEFRGRDTFFNVWLQGIAFFCANIAILARLIGVYSNHEKIN